MIMPSFDLKISLPAVALTANRLAVPAIKSITIPTMLKTEFTLLSSILYKTQQHKQLIEGGQ
jgi:hypothetical protein